MSTSTPCSEPFNSSWAVIAAGSNEPVPVSPCWLIVTLALVEPILASAVVSTARPSTDGVGDEVAPDPPEVVQPATVKTAAAARPSSAVRLLRTSPPGHDGYTVDPPYGGRATPV